mgnify:CR=1 FL=1
MVEIAIGIDLGTSNSVIGVFQSNQVEIAPNSIGDTYTPSVVDILDEGELVGEETMLHKIDENITKNRITEIKRVIGRKFSSLSIQEKEKFNEILRSLMQEKNITLAFDDAKHYEVLGDMFRIEQVVTNYLNNAIKNIDGERKINISIEEKENHIVRVNVENTGKNISEEDLSRIWVRFYKVDNSRTRSAGGSGIGLSLVRAIMTQHGNEYGVNNTEDGVNFWFELNQL